VSNPSLPLDKAIADLLLAPVLRETDNCTLPLPGMVEHPQLGQLHYLLPLRIVHSVLGALEFEAEYRRYNGKVTTLGHETSFSLTIADNSQLVPVISLAAHVIRQLEPVNATLRQSVTDYLSRFSSRQAWNDHYRISQADFDNTMQLQSVYFWSTELIEFYYIDKFNQHGAWFEVTTDLEKQMLYISLQ
jgi:hypothetical protein